MASIHLETVIEAPAEDVWAALAAVGEAHKAFSGVLSDCRLEREDVRVATFVNGLVVKERIVSVDQSRMRIAYAVIESALEHHGASMQGPHRQGRCVPLCLGQIRDDQSGQGGTGRWSPGCIGPTWSRIIR